MRAPNGDLLLCHKDSVQHVGGDGFVHQWRSTDEGFTWQDEGPVADWRRRNIDALFGEYGVASNGSLVMIVQRKPPLGGDSDVIGSVWSLSADNGKTWKDQGEVDSGHKYAVMYGRSVITRDGVMYFGAWSRLGNALYTSDDNGESWKKRSVIFPNTYPDFMQLKNAGPPFYPHVMFLPDGRLLAITYHTPPENCCYTRVSRDQGRTWGRIEKRPDLPVWAPRLNSIGSEILVLTGRDIKERATVAMFSTDRGRMWGNKMVVDRPKFFPGSYAYTDSIQVAEDKLWVFTSTPRSPGKGDIVGILLKIQPGHQASG